MTTTPPTPSPVSSASRRRRWPWVVGFCLAPFVVLGLVAVSYLSLDRDAAILRRHVMKATDSHWRTKVQISVGGLTLGGLRTVLSFVKHAEMEKARLGLRAVTRASVGVYQRVPAERGPALEQLMVETDRGMRQRGWSRLIGVRGKGEVVLAYVPANADAGQSLELCLAVIKDCELVVVSTCLDAEALADLVQQQLSEELRGKLHRQLQTARHGGVVSLPASE